jgi:hypothetical protein
MTSALVESSAGSRTVSTAVAGAYQERLCGNNAQVWRAICVSSCEARTSTWQRDAASLMGLFADRFRASSRLTPIQDKPPQITARASPSFSPMEQAAADPLSRGAAKPTRPISLKPGTRLVREWRGVTHMVLIHADSIEWRGQHYHSLSMVAREITSARWSGPRFFGLRQRQLDSYSSARAGHGEG